jgi:steroid 5-alpha reductase family enzyme
VSKFEELAQVISAIFAAGAVSLCIFTLLWVVSLVRRDASVVDFYWGPGVVVLAWTAWGVGGADSNILRLAVLAAVTLWGLRLGWHILRRHRGEEDARYAAMRARNGAGWPLKSLGYVFWLQAIIQLVAASAALVAAVGAVQPVAWIVWAGLAVFVAGFIVEAMSDRAVARFAANPANRGKLLTTGLHARVRYPSYLGEIILQFGLALAAFGLTLNPLAFVGAAVMTALIIKVSGVPLLEEQFSKRAGYAEWATRTNTLWPKL